MREVFGEGRVAPHPSGGHGLELRMCHKPIKLLSGFDGGLPDLTAMEGNLCGFVGFLATPGENLGTAQIHLADLFEPTDPSAAPSPAWCAIAGNLGNDPETAKSSGRVSASLAYDKRDGKTSWLRLISYDYLAASKQLAATSGGARLVACGYLETFVYKDTDRTQLVCTSISKLPSSAPPQPKSFYSSRPPEAETLSDPFSEG